MSVELVAEHLKIPFQKKYMLDDVSESDHGYAAEIGGEIAGFIALRIEEWNRRAILTHLYVAPGFQRRGIGKALMDAAANYAKTQAARCLWLETQNVNYPAIQFYKKLGFSFCGFDKSLYDGAEADETALFFCRSIRVFEEHHFE